MLVRALSILLCLSTLVSAGETPFRGPVCSGTWRSIRAGHSLVYLDGDRLLDWVPATGHYRVWRYDRNRSGKVDPLPGDPVAEGTWKSIGEGHELIYLGEDRLLDWVPETGQYRIFDFDRSKIGARDPLSAEPIVQGKWGSIKTGHQLIYMGGDAVLDFEPKTGRYRLWAYDREKTGAADPFPGNPLVEGAWKSIKEGHHLMQFDGDRVLDWEDSGHYRIWNYDMTARGKGDPFPGAPVAEGAFKTAGPSQQFYYLDGDCILQWDSQSGAYCIWNYEDNADTVVAAEAAADAVAQDAEAERRKAAQQEHLRALEKARKEAIDQAVADARDEAEMQRLEDELAAIKAKKQQDDAAVARAREEAQKKYELELKKREVAKARQEEALAAQKALALTRQGVVALHNPITTSSQGVSIVFRWKMWNGSYTQWAQYKVADKRSACFAYAGAVALEVKFSSSGGGEKKYSLEVCQVPSTVKATVDDGNPYTFYWAKQNALDMSKGKPKK